ncbi:hypothetical protein LP420_13525 [Massilia sp. B-10]|nr:hypothetical protein LP420_13525 [Massilia sp. B-10]
MIEQAHRSAQFDLTLSLSECDGALTGTLEYATDLFDAATVRRLLRLPRDAARSNGGRRQPAGQPSGHAGRARPRGLAGRVQRHRCRLPDRRAGAPAVRARGDGAGRHDRAGIRR